MAVKEKPFNMRISVDMYEKIKKLADSVDKSMADYIRDAINEKMKREAE